MNADVAAQRLNNQRITRSGPRRPEDIVAWLGAVQAQEYPAARWGLGQRMRAGATDADVRRAVDAGRILRTHVMRPTWHFVTPDDIRWMLELTAPRVHRFMSHYYRREELDAPLFTRATGIVERVLGTGDHLTRAELGVHLARAGVTAKGVRLAMIAMYAELEGVICSGAYRGKQLTYALLAERAPRSRRLSRDAALAELTRRFFTSHAPATQRDFAWWSGLSIADAKRGLEMNRARQDVIDGRTYWTIGRVARAAALSAPVHLLPVYDEYIIAYRDRDAVPHSVALNPSGPGGPLPFLHPLVIDGQLAGTWRPVHAAPGVVVKVIARRLKRSERTALTEAATRYGRFLDAAVTVYVQ